MLTHTPPGRFQVTREAARRQGQTYEVQIAVKDGDRGSERGAHPDVVLGARASLDPLMKAEQLAHRGFDDQNGTQPRSGGELMGLRNPVKLVPNLLPPGNCRAVAGAGAEVVGEGRVKIVVIATKRVDHVTAAVNLTRDGTSSSTSRSLGCSICGSRIGPKKGRAEGAVRLQRCEVPDRVARINKSTPGSAATRGLRSSRRCSMEGFKRNKYGCVTDHEQPALQSFVVSIVNRRQHREYMIRYFRSSIFLAPYGIGFGGQNSCAYHPGSLILCVRAHILRSSRLDENSTRIIVDAVVSSRFRLVINCTMFLFGQWSFNSTCAELASELSVGLKLYYVRIYPTHPIMTGPCRTSIPTDIPVDPGYDINSDGSLFPAAATFLFTPFMQTHSNSPSPPRQVAISRKQYCVSSMNSLGFKAAQPIWQVRECASKCSSFTREVWREHLWEWPAAKYTKLASLGQLRSVAAHGFRAWREESEARKSELALVDKAEHRLVVASGTADLNGTSGQPYIHTYSHDRYLKTLASAQDVEWKGGSGPFSANAEPEPPVGSGNPPNPEPERQVQSVAEFRTGKVPLEKAHSAGVEEP
ncbi:hypothetical protein C8R44DRAFT_750549 [Mycena epipterygia]|nr:hypothetical protein C8R44DRAFT_750549 [Mycena epipterygia]